MSEVAEIMSLTAPNNRRAYQPPRLSLLGEVSSLTETGSRDGMEDGSENTMCSNIIAPVNTTFNMC